MKNFQNIDEILEFAIQSEQKAVEFYTRLAEEARIPAMKTVFLQFAKEEMGHKSRLSKIKSDQLFDLPVESVQDMKISDYTAAVEPSPTMGYSEVLLLAMSREKAAFKVYSKLVEQAPTQDLKNLFLALAQEEAKHKLRFELEYDEFVLSEN